jgi:23S rRNA (uracil1939-C5)-methyltransferase
MVKECLVLRAMNKNTILENITIIGTSSDGKAVAKHNDLVIFVENAVPGDVGIVSVRKKKRSFLEGKMIEITQPSKDRVEAFCEHFGVCGGCKWQDMNYEAQLHFKQQQVADALTRIGKIKLPEISPILPSPLTTFYRNKLEFTFSNYRWLKEEEMQHASEIDRNGLGFHIPQSFSMIVDVNKCHLQPDPSNEIRLAIKKYAIKYSLSFFNLKDQNGLLRNLIIRTANTGQLMVLISFFENDSEAIEKLLRYLADKFPSISSLLYVINPKGNDTIYDLEVKVFKGNDHIIEEMEPADNSGKKLQFKIHAKSFFQTNSQQARNLYKIAFEYADLKGNEVVYDLYTGTGTIANFIAHKASKVIGIDNTPDAINDAKENSIVNNISNTYFYSGDLKAVMNDEFINIHGKPDVIITDPPRAGMHEDVVMKLLEIEAAKIVYISCNPATQARDLNILDKKYEVMKVQPVDMFPHTHHVENVVLLKLK